MPVMPTPRFLKGQFFASAVSTQDLTWTWCDESKLLFEILKAPCFRTSAIAARGCKFGPNLWQEHHHKANDAPRGASKGKRECTSIWDRWQNDDYRKSQLVHDWSDAWVRYSDHIAQIDISHKAPNEQMERYKNLLYFLGVDENKQAPPLPQRPGYQDATNALVDMQKQSWQDLGIPFIPIS